jgi:hypothetical protein
MTIQASPNPSYDFLSHPPTPRIQPSELRPPTPTTRTISRPGSSTSTITAISAWVAGVLPGPPPPATPTAPSTFSPRPSLLGAPHSAHQHSTPFTLFPETAAPYMKAHDPDLRAHSYTYTVVPLSLPPSTSVTPPRSSSPNNRRGDSGSDEMKRSRFTLMRQPKGSIPETPSRSPTPSRKKGLMRFLRPRSRFRSTNTQPPSPPLPSTHARKAPPLPSPSSPTTIAFRIAHQKRALYAKCGALPLPLDSEIAIMQFVDGGSRTDAAARLGGTFKDAAGVIYTDEEEAGECLPLLLVAEGGLDGTSPFSVLPSARSGGSDGFTFPAEPPSPLFARNTLPAPVPHSPAQVPVASSPRALLSIPARGGGACAPGYLHAAPPLLPPPFGDISSKDQFTPHVESMASGRKQRRRPAPLALHVPAHTMGFEDSFMPTVIEAPSLSAREALVAS